MYAHNVRRHTWFILFTHSTLDFWPCDQSCFLWFLIPKHHNNSHRNCNILKKIHTNQARQQTIGMCQCVSVQMWRNNESRSAKSAVTAIEYFWDASRAISSPWWHHCKDHHGYQGCRHKFPGHLLRYTAYLGYLGLNPLIRSYYKISPEHRTWAGIPCAWVLDVYFASRVDIAQKLAWTNRDWVFSVDRHYWLERTLCSMVDKAYWLLIWVRWRFAST